ncbi:MAG TPA: AAA family ATPase [Blastocatellia bacterium]|nr:AAA family ATPase [Blastocatellia bacterium]
MEAVILIGVQGSGKSTFCRERFFETHVRINLDMLKTRRREALLLRACLEAKQRFVVDNTNVTAADRQRYIGPASAAGFTVTGYFFNSRLEDALKRNRQRTGKSRIPERGVIGTYRRLELPQLSEGFDRLFSVSITETREFAVEEWKDNLQVTSILSSGS